MRRAGGVSLVYWLIVQLALFASPAIAAELPGPGYSVDFATNAGEPEMSLSIPPQGRDFTFRLIRQAGSPINGKVNLLLSSFIGPTDSVVENILLPDDKAHAKPSQFQDDVSVLRTLRVTLKLDRSRSVEKYVGILIVQEEGKKDLRVKITLQTSAASLVVSPNTEKMSFTLCAVLFPCYQEPPAFSVTLRDKTRQSPISGVSAELVDSDGPSNFDLNRNVTFFFDSRKVDDFTAGSADLRSIAVGGQTQVQGELKNLSPGKYVVTMRFRAANSSDNDRDQKLVLTFNVSGSAWWAVLWLLTGLLAAYIPAKGLSFRNQQLNFKKQITNLGEQWLGEEPQVVQVVWVRAMLRQAEDMSSWWWLRGPDVISERLTQVTALVGVLGQARQLRREFANAAGWDPMIRIRALAALNRAIANLGTPPVDTQLIETAKADLASLGDWLKQDKLEAAYWAEVTVAIAELLVKVQPVFITDPEQKAVIVSLTDALTKAAPPTSLAEKVARERVYARLLVLWERSSSPEEFKALIALHKQQLEQLLHDQKELKDQPILKQLEQLSIKPIFDAADQAAWKRLKDADTKKSLTIVWPRTHDPDRLCEAFEPLLFKLDTGDPALDRTYLVKHGLRYEWTFEAEKQRCSWIDQCKKKLAPWSQESDEPKIVEYYGSRCELKPSVVIRRDGVNPLTVKGKPLTLTASADFRFLQGFEITELTALTVTFAIAVITGLAAVYYKNDTFGSLRDYISLFVWGVGADVTKNGLQTLQSSSGWPKV